MLAELVGNGWLARHGLVVVERGSRGPAPQWPPGVGDGWQRRYGETTLHFAEELSAAATEEVTRG